MPYYESVFIARPDISAAQRNVVENESAVDIRRSPDQRISADHDDVTLGDHDAPDRAGVVRRARAAD